MITSETPETDSIADDPLKSWTHKASEFMMLARKLERERNALIEAVRNVRDTKGRHNTEIACKRLFDLLPESHKRL